MDAYSQIIARVQVTSNIIWKSGMLIYPETTNKEKFGFDSLSG